MGVRDAFTNSEVISLGESAPTTILSNFTDYVVLELRCNITYVSPDSRPIWATISFLLDAVPTAPVSYNVSDVEITLDAPDVLNRTRELPPPRARSVQGLMLEAPTVTRELFKCPHLRSGLLKWEDPATWPSQIVPLNGSSVILPENAGVLVSRSSNLQDIREIVIPSGSSLVFADEPMSIWVDKFTVLSGGSLFAGADDCPIFWPIVFRFNASKTVTPSLRDHESASGMNVSAGGLLQLVGRPFLSWTRLATSAYIGDDVIVVQTAVDWRPRQEIVIMSSVLSDSAASYDVVEIAEVSADGKMIKLASPIQYYHYSGGDYQAEVGLLTRTIRMLGPESGPALSDLYGGNLHIRGRAIISGVQFKRMGQYNLLFQYPLALVGASESSRVEKCSFVDSFYGCLLLLNTSGASVLDNVGHHVPGHCINLWSGRETNNTIAYNSVSYIVPVGRNPDAGVYFVDLHSSPSYVDPTEYLSSGIFSASRQNTFSNNVVSGAWAGYFFPQVPDFRDGSGELAPPGAMNLTTFDGNFALAATVGFYIQGVAYTDNSTGVFTYSALGALETGTIKLQRSKSALSGCSFNIAALYVEVDGFELTDSIIFGEVGSFLWLNNGLWASRSTNELSRTFLASFGVTIRNQKSIIISNVTFSGIDEAVVSPVPQNALPIPFGMSGISVESIPISKVLPAYISGWNIFSDCDCSLISSPGARSCAISNLNPYWNHSLDVLTVPEWPGMYHQLRDDRGIARLDLGSAGIIGDPRLPSGPAAAVTWQNSLTSAISDPASIDAPSGVIVGFDSTIWNVKFLSGITPILLNITLIKLSPGKFVILTFPFPSVPVVVLLMTHPRLGQLPVPLAPSYDSLVASAEPSWYYDSGLMLLIAKVSYPAGFAPTTPPFSRAACSIMPFQDDALRFEMIVSS
jgi:hypothetical protein